MKGEERKKRKKRERERERERERKKKEDPKKTRLDLLTVFSLGQRFQRPLWPFRGWPELVEIP